LLNGGILYHIGALANGVAADPANKFVYVTNGRLLYAATGSSRLMHSFRFQQYHWIFINYVKGTLTTLADRHLPVEQALVPWSLFRFPR
jgi:hypothetical protein